MCLGELCSILGGVEFDLSWVFDFFLGCLLYLGWLVSVRRFMVWSFTAFLLFGWMVIVFFLLLSF